MQLVSGYLPLGQLVRQWNAMCGFADSVNSILNVDASDMVQVDGASNGGSGSCSSGPMADLDDDEENAKPWKQGDASKQVRELPPFTSAVKRCLLNCSWPHSCNC